MGRHVLWLRVLMFFAQLVGCAVFASGGLRLAHAAAYLASTASHCDQYPKVSSLQTQVGTCVGLVTDATQISWRMPRKILFVSAELAYVTDMGSWNKNEGGIWELAFAPDITRRFLKARKVFSDTDRSHGLRLGPDNKVYWGDATAIYRFDPHHPQESLEKVITSLPDEYRDKQGVVRASSHPLTEFVFLPNRDLVVNVGAPSNDCKEEFQKSKACFQRDEQAELRRYIYDKATQTYLPSYQALARGLRNSLGLAYNEIAGTLLQAENSADHPGTPDELNIISLQNTQSQDFGWPFCFADGQRYPGYMNFKSFCQKQAHAPYLLFPAHAAPLDLRYYVGNMFPELQDTLLVSWHGHRPSGSFLVAYALNQEAYPFVDNNKAIQGHMELLISGWQKDPYGRHPKGRPTGFDFDSRGAIFILDDVNATLLILAKERSSNHPAEPLIKQPDSDMEDLLPSATSTIWGETQVQSALTTPQLQTWNLVFKQAIVKYDCQSCHSDVVVNAKPLLSLAQMLNQGWLDWNKNALSQLLWIKMIGANGARIMPPDPAINILSEKNKDTGAYNYLEQWLQDVFGI